MKKAQLEKMSQSEQVRILKKRLLELEKENILLKEVAKNANESRDEVKKLKEKLESLTLIHEEFVKKEQELEEKLEQKEDVLKKFASHQPSRTPDSWFLNNLKNQAVIHHPQKSLNKFPQSFPAAQKNHSTPFSFSKRTDTD